MGTGFYEILAEYRGTDNYLVSNGTGTLTVTVIPTSLTVNPISGYKGDPVVLTATLWDTAHDRAVSGKTIKFYVNDELVGSGTTNAAGVATCDYTIAEGVGSYIIKAVFDADTQYAGINGTSTLTVIAIPTSLTVNNPEGYNGNTVQITATLTDTAHEDIPVIGKDVTITINGQTYIGSTDSNGQVTWSFPISGMDAKNYLIQVSFDGDIQYASIDGTGTLTVTVIPTSLTVSPVSGYKGDPVVLTATLWDTAHDRAVSGKTIKFYVNGQYIGEGVTNSAGVATYEYIITQNVGTYTIGAVFNADTQYASTSDSGILTVTAIPTSLTVDPVSGYKGDKINLTATLKDTAHERAVNSKTIKFYINGEYIGEGVTNADGVATCKYTITQNVGTYPNYIKAIFNADTQYAGVNDASTLTVNKVLTSTTVDPVSGYPGQNVNLTAHVTDYYGTDMDEGTVRFTVNNITAGTVNVINGLATFTWKIPINWKGKTYKILANYLGTTNYLISNNTNNLTVTKTPTNTTVTPVTGYAGKNVSLKANVTDSNGSKVNEGQIKFTVNNVTKGTANVINGIATLNWKIPSSWKANKYTLTVKYLETSKYLASNGTSTLTIKPTANLVFTQTVSKGTHYYGNTMHYYITVKNNGPSTAAKVSVYDKLPSGVKYLSSSTNKGSYKSNIWNIGTLTVGKTVKLTIKALINKVGTIKNTAKLTQTTRTTPVTKSTSFNVPKAVPYSQLIKASKDIKKYYETHNNKLPKNLKVAGQTLTMPQLLKLFTQSTINFSKNNHKPISVTKVKKAPSPGGIYTTSKLYNYITIAKNIRNFINKQGRAPNYAQTTLGRIPFSKLVYMYSKVVNFYGKQKRLPRYVATYKI